MKLLLDTHIFIWWVDQPEKLSLAALSALEDEAERTAVECGERLGNAD
jgi:PIN domain nuclease of toxin-antitoxin system